MDGKYLNKTAIQHSIYNWLESNYIKFDSWEGNNIHIDEISLDFKKSPQKWLDGALFCYEILFEIWSTKQHDKKNIIPLLHIELSVIENIGIQNIAKHYLKNLSTEIDDTTPPSLMMTDFEYFNTLNYQQINLKGFEDLIVYISLRYEEEYSECYRCIYLIKKSIVESDIKANQNQ